MSVIGGLPKPANFKLTHYPTPHQGLRVSVTVWR
jgi:hypothetical protein